MPGENKIIGANMRIGREIRCLPYAGFFVCFLKPCLYFMCGAKSSLLFLVGSKYEESIPCAEQIFSAHEIEPLNCALHMKKSMQTLIRAHTL